MSVEGRMKKLKPELEEYFKDPEYLVPHETGWWVARGLKTSALIDFYCEIEEKEAFISMYGCMDNINRSVEHYLIYVQLEAPNHIGYWEWLKEQKLW